MTWRGEVINEGGEAIWKTKRVNDSPNNLRSDAYRCNRRLISEGNRLLFIVYLHVNIYNYINVVIIHSENNCHPLILDVVDKDAHILFLELNELMTDKQLFYCVC